MIAALVPAAGSSARMGRPKLLFTFGGQSLIGQVVTALRGGGAGRVVVVAPPADAPEGPGVASEARRAGAQVVVPVTRPDQMSGSIKLGLETLAQPAPPQSLILTPGDLPGITAEIVSRLVKHAAVLPDRIIIPRHNGQRGHPIVLPWTVATRIHALPAGTGVNALVAQYKDRVSELELENPGVVADLDTPRDLDKWLQVQGSEGLPNVASRLPAAGPQGPNGEPCFRVRVRLFALAKERAGETELEIELRSGSTVGDLRAALGERLPALGPLLTTSMIAVDEEYASDDVLIAPGARLAVIPPVSGGSEGRRDRVIPHG
jgi:molybdenum cofactor cytidylyltransferase